METTITSHCVEFIVEFEIYGRDRPATHSEPAEEMECNVLTVAIGDWEVTDIIQQRIIDDIANQIHGNLRRYAREERESYLCDEAEYRRCMSEC